MMMTMIMSNLLLDVSAWGVEEYSFTVKNSTDTGITKVLVSEDGKSWNYFDIGIKPNEVLTLIWIDNSESEVAIFDFCEKDLALVF